MAVALQHAVLLAAGRGERLRPLTDQLPKPLLPIDGRPVIERLLDQLFHAGIATFHVVVGHARQPLEAFLEDWARQHGAHVTTIVQPEAKGSADALQHALAGGFSPRDAVIAASDTVWRDQDVSALLAAFTETRPMVCMGMRRWPIEQLPHRSCVALDDEGNIMQVLEKPRVDQIVSALSGSPIYAVSRDFWPYVAGIDPSDHGRRELATGLQRCIDDGHTVRGVEVFQTRDITRPMDILEHNFPYLRPYLR